MNDSTAVDLRKEPFINELYTYGPMPTEAFREGILVTGPNSFIGINTLKQLTLRWNGEIHCLMRADNSDHARRRLGESALRWGIKDLPLECLHIHVGEVTQAGWGMEKKKFLEVREAVGSVVHLALRGRYDIPYEYYRTTWVPELRRMIDYCADPVAPKYLHYPGSYNSHFMVDERDFARLDTTAWHSGYTGFKWVAEHMLRRAFGGNLRGCIYDIPIVYGSAETGLCPPQYSVWLLYKIFLLTNMAVPFTYRMIPVDVLAEVIATNAAAMQNGSGSSYLRPVLERFVTLEDIIDLTSDRGIIRKGTREDIMRVVPEPEKLAYVLPEDFTEIIERAHRLSPIMPPWIDSDSLPDPLRVIAKNIDQWFMRREKRKAA